MAHRGVRFGGLCFLISVLVIVVAVVVVGVVVFSEGDDGDRRDHHQQSQSTALNQQQSKSSQPMTAASAAPSDPSCPHSGSDASAGGPSCDKHAFGRSGRPRADVDGGSERCESSLLPPDGCVTQSDWTVSVMQTPGWQPYTLPALDSGPSCGGDPSQKISFDVTVTKTDDANVYVTGMAKLRLTNNGNCDAKLSSLLLLLEQKRVLVNPSAAGQPLGPSYGPESHGYVVWAIDGAENSQTSGHCGTPDTAQICMRSQRPMRRCNVTVPFTQNTLADQAGALDLVNYVVPAHTNCHAAVLVSVQYVFKLSLAQFAAMQAQPQGFRLTALVTYDACCRTSGEANEDACILNIDCDGDGNLDIIRTTSIESDCFTFGLSASQCTKRCDCVTGKSNDHHMIAPSPLPVGCQVQLKEFDALQQAGSICATPSAPFRLVYPDCCDTSSPTCAGTGTIVVTDINTPMLSPVPGPNDCTDFLNPSVSLIGLTSSSATETFSCALPQPVDCVSSTETTCGPCDSSSGDQTCTTTVSVVTPAAHGGVDCTGIGSTSFTQCCSNCNYGPYGSCGPSQVAGQCVQTRTSPYDCCPAQSIACTCPPPSPPPPPPPSPPPPPPTSCTTYQTCVHGTAGTCQTTTTSTCCLDTRIPSCNCPGSEQCIVPDVCSTSGRLCLTALPSGPFAFCPCLFSCTTYQTCSAAPDGHSRCGGVNTGTLCAVDADCPCAA
jgi:hypothetical protein